MCISLMAESSSNFLMIKISRIDYESLSQLAKYPILTERACSPLRVRVACTINIC